MDVIKVHTTQNIDIDYEIGGIGERIIAYIIDLGIFIAFSIIGLILSINGLDRTATIVYFVFISIALLFYDLACETFFNGQTLGKRVMNIKVISLDGNRPKFSQYLLRWLFRSIDFSITVWLGGIISIIVSDKGQRIGDLVAGTIMVRTKPRTNRNNIIYQVVQDNYQPIFPQVINLKEAEIALIYDVIETYTKTGNSEAVYKTSERIVYVLGINKPIEMNALRFLQTIIKDFSYLTANSDQV